MILHLLMKSVPPWNLSIIASIYTKSSASTTHPTTWSESKTHWTHAPMQISWCSHTMMIPTGTPTGTPRSLGCFMSSSTTQALSIPLNSMSYGYTGMARTQTPAISQGGGTVIYHGLGLWSIPKMILAHPHLVLSTPSTSSTVFILFWHSTMK